MNQVARPLKQEWIKERQDRFYSGSDRNWDYLHLWARRRIGHAIEACIPKEQAVRFLQSEVRSRQGKTSYSEACKDIEKTAENRYSKDPMPTVGGLPPGSSRTFRASVPCELAPKLTPEEKAAKEAAIISDNLKRVITQSNTSELNIIEQSPCPIPIGLHHHAKLFFQTMFEPTALLFAAPTERIAKEAQRDYIKPAKEWAESSPGVNEWDNVNDVPQFLCISPLTGKPNSEGSYRAGDCRASVPFMLVEIDDAPLQRQRDLWLSLILKSIPVVALVYSGKKSYHAWILARGETIAERDEYIRGTYERHFDGLGVDRSKKGKATIARVPGSYRRDKSGAIEQNEDGMIRAARLVYLNSSLVCEVDG